MVEAAPTARWVAAIISSVLVTATVHARDGAVVLFVPPADSPGFVLGLQQQLAGRNVQIEIAEAPEGGTTPERRAAALDLVRFRRSAAAVLLERDGTGERTLVALSTCGWTRSAPVSPDEAEAQRALAIVATSLLDELFADPAAGRDCEATDVYGRTDAPAKPTSYLDDERPPIMRRGAARSASQPTATGLPPWVAIAGLGASAGLGVAAYLALPTPAQRVAATSSTSYGLGGTTAPEIPPPDSRVTKLPNRTPSYALGASAAVIAVASIVTAVFLTDWDGTDERDTGARVALAVSPRAASVAVAASF